MPYGKSCFFIGHREADERLLPRLEMIIERLIAKENIRYFYVGGYGGFDRIAAAAVKHAKQKYPDITLMLVLPYHPAEHPVDTPNGFDGTYYPDLRIHRGDMQSCVPTKSWLILVIGWCAMFDTVQVIPETCWSMLSGGRERG